MPPANNTSVDAILENLKGDAAGATSDMSLMIKLEEMKQAAMDRRDALDREQRREERADKARADQMQLILGLATSLLPSLVNKGTDPAILALISQRGSSEEMKSIMELQRQQSAATMELQLKSMLSIIQTKDDLNKKVLDDVLNRETETDGSGSSGIAGILREVRLGIGALAGGAPMAQNPALPAPAHGGPAKSGEAPAQPQAARHPVQVVLHQMMAVQEGKAAKPLIARAAMVTVALNDDGLVDALLSDSPDDVYAYCLPHVRNDAVLVAWMQKPGVAEWLEKYLVEQLVPQVDMAVNGDEADTDEEADNAGDAVARELRAEATKAAAPVSQPVVRKEEPHV